MRYVDNRRYNSKDVGGHPGYVYSMMAAACIIAPPPHFSNGALSFNHQPAEVYAAYSDDASGAGSSDNHTNQAISASRLLPKLCRQSHEAYLSGRRAVLRNRKVRIWRVDTYRK